MEREVRSMTQTDNLPEPSKEQSSLTPGVSGESQNAPYGPKAVESTDISSLKDWGDRFNNAEDGWAVGGVGNLSQTKEQSSLKP